MSGLRYKFFIILFFVFLKIKSDDIVIYNANINLSVEQEDLEVEESLYQAKKKVVKKTKKTTTKKRGNKKSGRSGVQKVSDEEDSVVSDAASNSSRVVAISLIGVIFIAFSVLIFL